MKELRLNTKSLNRLQQKELMEYINTTRAGRYGTIDVFWNRDQLLLRFYDEADVLAFKLKYDYDKMAVSLEKWRGY